MIDQILSDVLPSAYALLPPPMQSDELSALLIAIGLQQSRFMKRRPETASACRGFWFLEPKHLAEIFRYSVARGPLVQAAHRLRYSVLMMDRAEVLQAVEHNDTLSEIGRASCRERV